MKTWEMIKALTENPTLVFVSQDGYKVFIDSDNGCLRHVRSNNTESFGSASNIRLVDCGVKPDEWELVPQEVTWQEAIQAWLDGRSIRVELNSTTKKQPPIYRLGCLLDGNGFEKRELRDGKWFIE